jgi:hypothetical protein
MELYCASSSSRYVPHTTQHSCTENTRLHLGTDSVGIFTSFLSGRGPTDRTSSNLYGSGRCPHRPATTYLSSELRGVAHTTASHNFDWEISQRFSPWTPSHRTEFKARAEQPCPRYGEMNAITIKELELHVCVRHLSFIPCRKGNHRNGTGNFTYTD